MVPETKYRAMYLQLTDQTVETNKSKFTKITVLCRDLLINMKTVVNSHGWVSGGGKYMNIRIYQRIFRCKVSTPMHCWELQILTLRDIIFQAVIYRHFLTPICNAITIFLFVYKWYIRKSLYASVSVEDFFDNLKLTVLSLGSHAEETN